MSLYFGAFNFVLSSIQVVYLGCFLMFWFVFVCSVSFFWDVCLMLNYFVLGCFGLFLAVEVLRWFHFCIFGTVYVVSCVFLSFDDVLLACFMLCRK